MLQKADSQTPISSLARCKADMVLRLSGYADGKANDTGVLESFLYDKPWPITTALVRRGLSGACVLEK